MDELDEEVVPVPEKKVLPKHIALVLDATNHFEVLGLPVPELDESGNLPNWGVADNKIQRQYKITSLRVHPDKHQAVKNEAKIAFDKATHARDCLMDVGLREQYLREFGLKLRSNTSSAWKPTTGKEQVRNAQAEVDKHKRKKAMEKAHFDVFRNRVNQQQKDLIRQAQDRKYEKDQRLKEKKRKREREETKTDSEDSEDSSSEEESALERLRRKKKQKRGLRF